MDLGALRGVVRDARDRRQWSGLTLLGRLELIGEFLTFFLALDIVECIAEALDLGLDDFVLGIPAFDRFGVAELNVALLRRGEKGLQAIVVALPDRIGHVIVAARAADGQAKERRADGVGQLREDFVAAESDVSVAGIATYGAEAVEAGGDLWFSVRRIDGVGRRVSSRAPRLRFGLVCGLFVAGDLFQYEAVERLVSIEAADDVVPKPPGAGAVAVVLKAFGLGIANDVEPMLAPSFAVIRIGQQSIDQALICVRRCVA